MSVPYFIDQTLVKYGYVFFFFAVFGWFNSSFTGSEQAASYRLQAGYLKGAQQAAVDLEFSVSTQPISAGMYIYILIIIIIIN